jgi:hypothetical protein
MVRLGTEDSVEEPGSGSRFSKILDAFGVDASARQGVAEEGLASCEVGKVVRL